MEPSQPNTFAMSDAEFKAIADIAYKEAGLVFLPEKASLVQSRINRRLRKLRLRSFSDYTSLVESEQGFEERKIMISSLTTNVSNFFREAHHFEILRTQVLPPLISRARNGGRVRLWSAGCSTGQEPYSMAMTLLDVAPDIANLDIKILASDIDPNVIATAKQGYYDIRSARDLSDSFLERYTQPQKKGSQEGFIVSDTIRNLVSFRELNLLKPWPISGLFDAIFCRNVVIYFDKVTQQALWPRFEAVMADDGWIFMGHSERLSDQIETNFVAAGPTAYRLSTRSFPTTKVE